MKPSSSNDLVHASHVRLAYRTMLGRDPSEQEVRIQLAGLTTTAELLRVLASSPEFTGTSRVLLNPQPAAARVNSWHADLAPWTHAPGTVSSDEVAVVGTEGWLFIQGGTNSNLEQHSGELVMRPEWATAWSELMAFRERDAKALGLTTAFVVIPDKLAVHEAQFPRELVSSGPRPAVRLLNELGLALTYPLAELKASRASGEVYLRTDSHYSLRGNFVIHEAVCQALGIDALPARMIADATSYLASGDLGQRFDPQIVEVMTSMLSLGAAKIAEDNREAVALTGGHIGSRRVFRNDTAPDARTAVIFGDSYGFSSEGYEGLSWFMAQLFREVHFIWAPFGWDGAYIQRVGAEVVICQTAERFIGRVPAQSVDADALVAQATSHQDAINPDVVFADGV